MPFDNCLVNQFVKMIRLTNAPVCDFSSGRLVLKFVCLHSVSVVNSYMMILVGVSQGKVSDTVLCEVWYHYIVCIELYKQDIKGLFLFLFCFHFSFSYALCLG